MGLKDQYPARDPADDTQEADGVLEVVQQPAAERGSKLPYRSRLCTSSHTNRKLGAPAGRGVLTPGDVGRPTIDPERGEPGAGEQSGIPPSRHPRSTIENSPFWRAGRTHRVSAGLLSVMRVPPAVFSPGMEGEPSTSSMLCAVKGTMPGSGVIVDAIDLLSARG